MFSQITQQLQKPDQDDRQYSLLRLTNEMEVLLISDPHTDKAAAALDVHVGNLSDPTNVDGLAHFLEHLLFMGTEKYPIENDYSQYLSVHGGHSNAFTSGDHTNFYFDISSDYLQGALDRFSQFFISPLFLDSCTERELQAVDSEHKKNMQSDMWRGYQVLKNLSDPKHPFSRFGTGNLYSLRDIPNEKGMNIRQILLDFHAKYYSANIMKLVVIGKESIEQLTEWVVEKFTPVNNMNVDVPTFSFETLSKEQLTTTIMLKPVKDTRQLMMIFPIKDYGKHYRTHPLQYFSHLIGHEGPGSILSLLKTKGWAHSLMAGSSGYGSIGFEFFRVVIDMTEKGLSHSNEIIKIVFQYIEMLKEHGVLEWVFNECQAISRMAFRFKEKASPSSYASSLAGNMHKFGPTEIISGSYLVEDFDQAVIASCFDFFKPANMQVMLVASAFQPDDDWKSCPWYGSKYKVVEMEASLKNDLESLKLNAELRLPSHNEFIAENFTVSHPKLDKPKVEPSLVVDTPLLRLWHKQDDTFMVPKANVYIEVRTPIAYQSAKNCMLTRLYSDLLKDCLNEFAYFAEVAGLNFNLENTTDGIILSLYGYNDKLHVLMSEICTKMASFPIDEFHFHRVKDATLRKLKGWYHEAPYSHATYFMSGFTQEKLFTTDEKLLALTPITLQDVKSFYRSILDHCHIECFVHGNVNVKEAQSLIDIYIAAMNPHALSTYPPEMRIHMVPPGKSIIYTRDALDEGNPNSAIEYCVQVGSAVDVRIRNLVNLVSQILHEPGFDQLRTKEQLGYTVYVGIRKQTEMISLRAIIQSSHHPMYLEHRIEEFFKLGLVMLINKTIISELTPEQYEKHQKALLSKLNEKYKNMGHETSRLWSHISSRYYDFEQNLVDSEMVLKITKQELIEFYESFILPSSPNKRKLSVHILSKKCTQVYKVEQVEAMELVKSRSDIVVQEQVQECKSRLELTKEPTPVKPLSSFLI